MDGKKAFALLSVTLMLSGGLLFLLPADESSAASVSHVITQENYQSDFSFTLDVGDRLDIDTTVNPYSKGRGHYAIIEHGGPDPVYIDGISYECKARNTVNSGAFAAHGVIGPGASGHTYVLDVGFLHIKNNDSNAKIHSHITIHVNVQKFTLSFDSRGGSSCGNMEGTSFTLPNAAKNGFVFDGWYTQPEGGTRVGGAGDRYAATSDMHLYAHWSTVAITSSPPGESLVAGNSFSYLVTTSMSASITITGPSWLTVSGNRIVGTTMNPGVYNVTVHAANGSSVANQSFAITVIDRLTFESAPTGSILVSGA